MQMTITQVAAIKGVTRGAIWLQIKQGKLKAEKIGNGWVIDIPDDEGRNK